MGMGIRPWLGSWANEHLMYNGEGVVVAVGNWEVDIGRQGPTIAEIAM